MAVGFLVRRGIWPYPRFHRDITVESTRLGIKGHIGADKKLKGGICPDRVLPARRTSVTSRLRGGGVGVDPDRFVHRASSDVPAAAHGVANLPSSGASAAPRPTVVLFLRTRPMAERAAADHYAGLYVEPSMFVTDCDATAQDM